MRTAPFKYTRANTVTEALAAIGEGGVILAGGQSLVQAMKLRRLSPAHLVDINAIADLEGISITPAGTIKIGALVRHAELANSPILFAHIPWLSEAAQKIADVQVRNRGTIGGNLCFADCRANLSPVLISLGAQVQVLSASGQRTFPVENLFTAFKQNALTPGELLASLEIPLRPVGTAGAYRELTRQPNDIPLINLAVTVTISNGHIAFIGIGAGGLAAIPIRLAAVEQALLGQPATEDSISLALTQFNQMGLQPPTELQSPPEYRVQMGRVLLKRALQHSFGISRLERGE